MSRPLVGRFRVSICGDFEFEPSILTGPLVVYSCEFLNFFKTRYILESVAAGEYVVVSNWHWINQTTSALGILAIDAKSITKEGIDIRVDEEIDFEISGEIVSISTILRIKNESDIFHNSYVIDLNNGKKIICRGIFFFWFKLFFNIQFNIDFIGLKRIKLKNPISSSVCIAYLTGPETRIRVFEKSLKKIELLCRVIEVQTNALLVSSDGKPRLIQLGAWAQCDRRRIGIGAVFSISNFHLVNDTIIACPARTCIVVHELPPVGGSYFPIYQLGQKKIDSKFTINSLCICECHLDISAAALDVVFVNALKAAELCLPLFSVEDIFNLKAPPFFNISVKSPVSVVAKGHPSAEVFQSLKKIPSTLYSGLFPPNRPLNAYTIIQFFNTNIKVLVSRDFKNTIENRYSVSQLLVIDTDPKALVHGIILNSDTLRSLETGIDGSIEDIDKKIVFPSRLDRRCFLKQMIKSLETI